MRIKEWLKIKGFHWVLLLLLAVFSVTGCGGGGSDANPSVDKAGVWDETNWDNSRWQ